MKTFVAALSTGGAAISALAFSGPGHLRTVTDGAVMDWGLQKRFFSDAQTKRLWLRDGGCTYPGCGASPTWTDGHHLIHWADLGPSDLDNAALLCDRHHTIVHKRRLAGRVVKGSFGERVEWDLTPGSYDELLARRAAQEPA